MWTFKAFVQNNGIDVLDAWYTEHSGRRWVKLWARFYAIMFHLRQQPYSGWIGSYYHPLKGKDGVGRIGFELNKIAYRHLGFRSAAEEFIFLFPAEEHDDEYLPKGSIDTAVSRMKLVQGDPSRAHVVTIKTPPEGTSK